MSVPRRDVRLLTNEGVKVSFVTGGSSSTQTWKELNLESPGETQHLNSQGSHGSICGYRWKNYGKDENKRDKNFKLLA